MHKETSPEKIKELEEISSQAKSPEHSAQDSEGEKQKEKLAQHAQEMQQEENKVKEEVEKEFKDALALLHTRIQLSADASKDGFPSVKYPVF